MITGWWLVAYILILVVGGFLFGRWWGSRP
jgi:hypothetical protein